MNNVLFVHVYDSYFQKHNRPPHVASHSLETVKPNQPGKNRFKWVNVAQTSGYVRIPATSPPPYISLLLPVKIRGLVLGFRVQNLGFRVQGSGFRFDLFQQQ